MSKHPSIVSLEDFDESKNILIYGDAGCGKTALAGSDDKVLFLSIEGGTVSASRLGSKADVWPIPNWEELVVAYTWLYENEDHGYQWVVLDSITRMQEMALRSILDNAVEENASRDMDIPAIQDHQKWQNMFKRFILAFCSLPTDCLFIALSRKETNEDGDEFLTPDIQGKGYQISQYVASLMSAYGYMKVVNKKVVVKKDGKEETKVKRVRRIIWQDNGNVRGKDRYNVLAPFTEDKTLKQIREMIEGKPQLTDEELQATKKAAAPRRRTAQKVS